MAPTSNGAGRNGGAGEPDWDWVGIVGTGQSLGVGGFGDPPAPPLAATGQRFGNLKLSLGKAAVPPFDPGHPALSMVPLVEPLRPTAKGYPSPYPRNIYGESPHTAMADQISTLALAAFGRDHLTVHTAAGEAGQPMSVIRKGATDTGGTGRAYAASLFEVAAIARLARAQDKHYRVGAILLTHGESDAENPRYEGEIRRLWSDYNLDLPPLTGQAGGIPMLMAQQHSSPSAIGSRSASTVAQWRIGVDRPRDIICVGPKYQYPYVADGIHLTGAGYQRLGEKYGQVYFRRVVLGLTWRPLQPIAAERAGRVITVRFHVPTAPLAWHEELPPPHRRALDEWARGRGFEVRAGAARIAISAVEIEGDAVRITCAGDLPATGVVVAYAASAGGTLRPGGSARWGLLRDSDPFVGSMTGVAQPNHCVAFELNVP